MNKKEKIGIIIVIVLIIIFVINIIAVQDNTNKEVKINCDDMCFKIGDNSWISPGLDPVNQNTYFTKEECVFACQTRFKK
jgi:hypothetical protein